MEKVVRLTEHDLHRIVKRVIREKDNEINELDFGNAVDAGLKVGKTLGLDSDWAYLTQTFPGLEMVKPTYDIVNAFRTMQKQTFEENMEQIREYMSGFKGMVISVALDTLAIGEVLNPVFWGLFAVYDSWLWGKRGVLNMLNIIMDLVGVATVGIGAKFVKGFKSVLGSAVKSEISTFIKIMAKKAPKLFQYIKPLFKDAGAIMKAITPQLQKGIAILSKKIPSMAKGLQTMKSGISTVSGVLAQLERVIGHEGVHFAKHVVKHDVQHKVAHAVAGGVVGHGEGHGEGGGHGEKQGTHLTQNKKPQTIPRYITVNGIKKPNPKFKEKYGYA